MSVPNPKLLDILRKCVSRVSARKNRLITALSVPFVLFLLLEYLWPYFDFPNLPGYLSWVYQIPNTFLYSVYAVITHRIILLGEDSVSKWGFTSNAEGVRRSKFVFMMNGNLPENTISIRSTPLHLLLLLQAELTSYTSPEIRS